MWRGVVWCDISKVLVRLKSPDDNIELPSTQGGASRIFLELRTAGRWAGDVGNIITDGLTVGPSDVAAEI